MKPRIKIETNLSLKPGRNYIRHLLHSHVNEILPARALDAGCGELVNFWMFPGDYVGISAERDAYFRGLQRPEYTVLAKRKILPEVYLTTLESDFSYLGVFDLCVCTGTLSHIKDKRGVVKRLSDRVGKGGSLIFDAPIDALDRLLPDVSHLYEEVTVVYWELECHEDFVYNKKTLYLQTQIEMETLNEPEGHKNFYLLARNKLFPPGPTGIAPKRIYDGGLYVVVDEIPNLKKWAQTIMSSQ